MPSLATQYQFTQAKKCSHTYLLSTLDFLYIMSSTGSTYTKSSFKQQSKIRRLHQKYHMAAHYILIQK